MTDGQYFYVAIVLGLLAGVALEHVWIKWRNRR